jgi:alkylation response protein AidB-like acyl-CoA dehydrogenase
MSARRSSSFAPNSASASPTSRLCLYAKIFTIFEGASEIQRLIIGRAVTGLDVR